MGSATTLYGVQLEVLQAAIGSRDGVLRERAKAATQPKPVTNVPLATVVFLADGGLIFNDLVMTPESLRAELAKPEFKGVRLHCIDQRSGNVIKRSQLSMPFLTAIQEGAAAGIVSGWEWEQASADDDDEFSLEQAIDELIDGRMAHRDEEETYQYGYALESLCLAIGQHLGTIEGELLLRHLKLKTPLSRQRKPIKLPASSDVPEISHLTSEDVRAEHERLLSLDLAFPKSHEVESGRREYAAIIAKAAEEGLAVIAFGY